MIGCEPGPFLTTLGARAMEEERAADTVIGGIYEKNTTIKSETLNICIAGMGKFYEMFDI